MTAEARALAPEAIALVRQWLTTAETIRTPGAARHLADMLRDEAGLDFVVGFVDQVVRPEDVTVAATNLARLGAHPPRFLPLHLRLAVRAGAILAPRMPGIVVPIARRVLRFMVGHLIIDATDAKLGKAITHLRKEGVSLNLNLLGEAVLGEREAERRLVGTTRLLGRDDVDYVSIKVSATVAPQQRWGFDQTVEHVIERLRPLYRLAVSSPKPKFINLDMEEYKDLELTMAVFTRILDEPEFLKLRAGIVLQAYLPDAMGAMVRLQEWSAARVARGGAPIKVRLVKGANLPMELIEAELHDWPAATVTSKQAADTNYKRVMNYALHPARIANVQLGVAGHNLFDLALAWLLANKRGVTQGLEFEMLLGMAPGQAEAVRRTVGGLLLYVPVVHPKEFDVAIAYLIRRLEEGASHDNFMSAVFELDSDELLFQREEQRFLASLDDLDSSVPPPNRVQSRLHRAEALPHDRFVPTADTDPSVLENQEWARDLRARMADTDLGVALQTSSRLETRDELEATITTALSSPWRDMTHGERAEILHRAGDELERRRGDLIVVAGAECGKTIDQSDPEVSEACDFAHYYAELARGLDGVDGAAQVSPGLVVVTPPWNFPVAIPAGSMLAGLATGASVIVKPAPLAERCSAVVVECLWAAGVPRDALAYVTLPESTLGSALVSDPRVDRVILTGGYETAKLFKTLRPELRLLAETSGKNAIIVTPNADLDLAVKDVVYSAFGHAGQKCSAASLVVLVGQVAESPRFRNQLLDAVRSLTVGAPTEEEAEVGPLVEPAQGKLLSGLTTLEPGQNWLVEPRRLDKDGQLWRPGVRGGVQRGSEFHKVEYFGPVLGVMTADSLDEAIETVNEVDYGLTSGLHSLDREEIADWVGTIRAGNLYVNRGTTGAIVQRQPFGGWKRSVVGATTKAGGPNYLVGLSDWRRTASTATASPTEGNVIAILKAAASSLTPDEQAFLARSASSDEQAWEDEYSRAADVQGLRAERNVLRYRPFDDAIVVRQASDGALADLVRVVVAALRVDQRPDVSVATPLPDALATALRSAGLRVSVATDAEFLALAETLPAGRVRLVGTMASWPARADLAIYPATVTESGRLEGLPFIYEQAVSITAHRFGTPKPLTVGIL